MSTLRKMLEAKKANILEEAQRKAAEIDHDMEELERLTGKYGLSISQPAVENAVAPTVDVDVVVTDEAGRAHILEAKNRQGAETITFLIGSITDALRSVEDASLTRRARVAAKAYIRAKNKPIPLAELDEVLIESGIKFESDTPRNTLSAVLGQDPELYSVSRDQGWWLKGTPIPEPEIKRRRLREELGHGG
jgi:hypothetical protein